MHDLADDPAIRVRRPAGCREVAQEVLVDHIRGIEAEAIDLELGEPAAHGREKVIADLGILEVELDEFEIAGPGLVGERITPGTLFSELNIVEPVAVRGRLAAFAQVEKLWKFPADVVEDTIEDDADAVLMEIADERFQILVGSEPAVDLPVIDRVVSVGAGFEKRTEIEGVAPEIAEVRDPVGEPGQPGDDRCVHVVRERGIKQPDRVDMVENRV